MLDEQLEIIKLRYQSGITLKMISEEFNINKRTISRLLRNCGVPAKTDLSKRIGMLANYENEIIKAYQDNIKSADIAKIYDCSSVSIRQVLKRNGIARKTKSECKRLYNVDEYFFDSIDTQEKAYILGWFYADGYNCRKTNSISIMIRDYDIEILQKIKKIMKHDGAIKIRKRKNDFSVLIICNKRLSERLEELGCGQKKSRTIRFPTEHVPDALMQHFIRGYFDGDGCICQSAKGIWIFNITSNPKFLSGISEYFEKIIGYQLKVINKETPTGSIVTNKKGSIKILAEYLYQDAVIWLSRKKQKFDLFLTTSYSNAT